MARHRALVTGVHGIVGFNLLEELAGRSDWTAVGLGRREAGPLPGQDYLCVDLKDANAVKSALAGLGDVTHLFFAAFQYAPDPYEEIAVNVAILNNTLDGLRAAGAPLQRVVIYQGGKAYGALLGSVRTPAKETDPRVPGPLFYYDQEDLLYARGAKEGFATTVLRPDFIQGIGFGSYVNLATTLAAYGTVCKALAQPLYFPGGAVAFDTLLQLTDARLLARGSLWAALEAHSDNIIYNITNGDLFRWSNLWPRLAAWFDVPEGRPVNLDLRLFMRDKRPLWSELKRRHGLVLDLDEIQNWDQAYVLGAGTEIHSSTIRIRQAGFQECLDSDDRMIALLEEMRGRKYIP